MIHGKNPMLLTVKYIRGDPKKEIMESFEVIYKDDDGIIRKTNEPPTTNIFFTKPNHRDHNYNKPQERIENLYTKNVPISKIRYEIANEIGEEGEQFIKQCYQSKDWKALNRLYGWRYAYACDFQPEFYFMRDWYTKYKLPDSIKITKAFMDIETDIIDYIPDLDKLSSSAHSPVNCVTVILEETKESYTFVLKPYKPSKISYSLREEYDARYKLYENQLSQYEDLFNNLSKFYDDLTIAFNDVYGHMNYHVRGYDSEIDLIADVFRLINDRKPNFCLCWNMRFDIQYLLERIKVLGYNPKSIMCHPDFDNPSCYFNVDKRTFQIEKQYDYFTCSSYTQYVCQMRLYSSSRKSQQMLKSVSLNAIGERELKDKKVEYESETDMAHFAYHDLKRFTLYNIKDVLLMVGIERKTNDVLAYYMKSHVNWTPYNKVFRETHLLRNVREQYFNREGWVQSNNINVIDINEDDPFYSIESSQDDEDDESTFTGAILADPAMNDNVGIPVLGRPSNVLYELAVDEDMSAFYPSCKIAANMDSSTLEANASFINEEFISGDCNNRSANQEYFKKDKNNKTKKENFTGEAIHTYATGNILTFAYNYMNLPAIDEWYEDIFRELNK